MERMVVRLDDVRKHLQKPVCFVRSEEMPKFGFEGTVESLDECRFELTLGSEVVDAEIAKKISNFRVEEFFSFICLNPLGLSRM